MKLLLKSWIACLQKEFGTVCQNILTYNKNASIKPVWLRYRISLKGILLTFLGNKATFSVFSIVSFTPS